MKKNVPTALYSAKAGFTFLEIMFVVVIIGILLALVGPSITGRVHHARVQATKAQIKHLETALKTFQMDTGTYPENLEELVSKPSDDSLTWNGPYLDSDVIPLDAWNKSFDYECPGRNNQHQFDLWSKGPDKQSGTEDDLCNWTRQE